MQSYADSQGEDHPRCLDRNGFHTPLLLHIISWITSKQTMGRTAPLWKHNIKRQTCKGNPGKRMSTCYIDREFNGTMFQVTANKNKWQNRIFHVAITWQIVIQLSKKSEVQVHWGYFVRNDNKMTELKCLISFKAVRCSTTCKDWNIYWPLYEHTQRVSLNNGRSLGAPWFWHLQFGVKDVSYS